MILFWGDLNDIKSDNPHLDKYLRVLFFGVTNSVFILILLGSSVSKSYINNFTNFSSARQTSFLSGVKEIKPRNERSSLGDIALQKLGSAKIKNSTTH